MSLDWGKIEERPEKKYLVEGKSLLEMRSEIGALKQELNQVMEEFKRTKEKLVGREKSLIQLTEKKSSARKSLDKIKEEKLHSEIEVTKLTAANSDLKTKLNGSMEKILTLENQLKAATTNTEQFESKILVKEKEIQIKEEEMLKKAKESLVKDKDIQNIKSKLEQRDKEIEFLQKNLKVEREKMNVQIKKSESFEAKMATAINALRVIARIKELMHVKGFLSDKELEPLLDEIE
ncbi:MAG: hypothetical protein ACXADU_11235 [Promethearchaeota archaeon]|jgi:chromosome segregation ATPase